MRIQNTVAASSSHTTITTTSNHTTHANGTTNQVLPKLEIPANTTIQIQSSNHSMANTAQVCIENMQSLGDIDVRKTHGSFLMLFYFSPALLLLLSFIHSFELVLLLFFICS